jgi:Lon protease-like protein
MSYQLPMFPLGSVLFPNTVLPLRVFEPRYQRLVDDCMAGDGRFGVVLIERGSEVGGGDTRFEVGTIAQIAAIADLEEGHRLVLAVGTGRFEVDQWLPDDPYPRAVISDLTDPLTTGSGLPIAETEMKLRRTLALMSEAGHDVGDTGFELSDEEAVAVDQLCALAPLSPLDSQRLLATDPSPERLARLQALLDEEIAVLQHQLGSG